MVSCGGPPPAPRRAATRAAAARAAVNVTGNGWCEYVGKGIAAQRRDAVCASRSLQPSSGHMGACITRRPAFSRGVRPRPSPSRALAPRDT
eukprot:6154573-Prymnesium_polylepis.1